MRNDFKFSTCENNTNFHATELHVFFDVLFQKKRIQYFFIVFHFHLLTAIWHSVFFSSYFASMLCFVWISKRRLFYSFCCVVKNFRLYYSFARSSRRHLFNLHCITPSFTCRPCFSIFFREHLAAFNYRLL